MDVDMKKKWGQNRMIDPGWSHYFQCPKWEVDNLGILEKSLFAFKAARHSPSALMPLYP